MAILVHIKVDDQGNAKVVQLGKNAVKAKKQIEPLGATLQKVFAGAGMLYGLNELRRGMVAMTSEVGKYEYNMKRIEGVGGITGVGLAKVGEGARELATDIEFSASRISEAMLEMIKQGFEDPDALMEAFPAIADLATAAMMDLNYAANNTLATMKSFGMETTQTSRVANVLATVLNKTAADAEDFMEGMKYAGAVSKETGASFEETSAILGVLSDAGIRGTMAGTSLRTMMLKLIRPTGAAVKVFQGWSTEGLNMAEIMHGLKERGLGLVDLLDLVDKRAITSASVLSGDKALAKMDELLPNLYDQLITAKEVATTIRTALIPSLMNLVNNLNEVGLSIFDAFGSRPTDAIAGLVEQVKKLDDAVDNNQEAIAELADKFKVIFDLVIKLAGGAFTLIAENIGTLTNAVIALVSVKALGKVPILLKSVNTMLTSTNWAGSWMGFTNAITATIMVVAGLQIAIDEIFKTINKNLDNQNKAVGDQSTKGLEKRMQLLYKWAQAKDDFERGKGNMNDPSAPIPDRGLQRERLLKLRALREEYEQYGKTAAEMDLKTSKSVRDHADNLLKILGLRKRIAEEKAKAEETKGETAKPTRVKPDVSKDYKKSMKDLEAEAKAWVDRTTDNWLIGIRAQKDSIGDLEKFAKDSVDGTVDTYMSTLAELHEDQKKATKIMNDSFWSMGQSTVDIVELVNERKLQSTIDTLEAEKEAIEDRYDTEINAIGNSAFKKEMLEQRKAKETLALDKKLAASKRELALRQRRIDNAQATANATRSVIGTIADTPGGPYTRIAAGVAVGAMTGSYLAQMLAINYRDGSRGIITGPGNTTSDSIIARVSKGERVISNQEMKQVGGNDRLQQMIDRGSSYSSGGTGDIYINNVIGTRQFVRDNLMPDIRRELRR